MSQTHKQKIAALLATTLILCDLISGSPAHLQARQKNNQTEWSEEPTPEPTVEPTGANRGAGANSCATAK